MQSNINLKQLIRQRWKSNAKFPELQQTNKQTGNNHPQVFKIFRLSTVVRQGVSFHPLVWNTNLWLSNRPYINTSHHIQQNDLLFIFKKLLSLPYWERSKSKTIWPQTNLSDTNASFVVYIMQYFNLLRYNLYTFI